MIGFWNILSTISTVNGDFVFLLDQLESIPVKLNAFVLQEEADTEWKFARSKIYMEFIKNNGELPVPFNIFPTPRSICRLFTSCCCKKEESATTQDYDDVEDARVCWHIIRLSDHFTYDILPFICYIMSTSVSPLVSPTISHNFL